MKKMLKGYILGVVTASLLIGSVAMAKSYTDYIEVTYDNIKVYKDNVLCQLKDGNGGVIEPFIYNGTTYMPVRGTANLAGMEVTWEGSTKSVYLWDDMVPDGTYLMEVSPPYETFCYQQFIPSNGKSFLMAGNNYGNGFTLSGNFGDDGYALINLNGKYKQMDLTIGRVDKSDKHDMSVSFVVDGKTVKTIDIGVDDMPENISVPLSYGLQLKVIIDVPTIGCQVGFGNITVR